MNNSAGKAVIRGVRYFLAHTPGLVRHGSKPSRDLAADPRLLAAMSSHLRSYKDALGYPPHRVFLGEMYPDILLECPRPWYDPSTWHEANGDGSRWGPHGEIMPEEEFYGLLKACDHFDLVWLEEGFTKEAARLLNDHPLVTAGDIKNLGVGHAYSAIESEVGVSEVGASAAALPLYLRDGRMIGCVRRAHDQDASLTPEVLLENLACKASATMATRTLLIQMDIEPTGVDYIINSGEEAVGERYQRGGGNLAKAVAEMCGCTNATGADVKAFCCGPLHALVMAAALVSAGVYRQVAVVAGCSLAKQGMKYRGHLDHDQPILEDWLA